MSTEIPSSDCLDIANNELLNRFLAWKDCHRFPGYVGHAAWRLCEAYFRTAYPIYADFYGNDDKAERILREDIRKARRSKKKKKSIHDRVESFVKSNFPDGFEPELYVFILSDKFGVLPFPDILTKDMAHEYLLMKPGHDALEDMRAREFLENLFSINGFIHPDQLPYLFNRASDPFQLLCLKAFFEPDSCDQDLIMSGLRCFMDDPFGKALRYGPICPSLILTRAAKIMGLAL